MQEWLTSVSIVAPKKTKIPTGLSPGRDQSWGWEFAMLSFPGRHLAPEGLPASRRYSPRQAELRPHSRAVQRLTVAGFRVRPLSSLGLAFAAPVCEPDKDTFVTFAPRLYHLTPGRPPLLAVRWPGVTGLTSYLSGCIWLTSQRCPFDIAGVLEGTDFCRSPFASRFARSLCLAFRRLSFGGLAQPARVMRSVLAHSSNRLPSG